MSSVLIIDTGPLVALLSRNDSYHTWAKEQFSLYSGPFLTCESVISESCFILHKQGFDPAKVLSLIDRGVIQLPFSLDEQIGSVRALFERYDNVPASLADACLIRMSELYDPCQIVTLDSDFHVYKRHGRKTIPLISP
jgi:uncharacterized protein